MDLLNGPMTLDMLLLLCVLGLLDSTKEMVRMIFGQEEHQPLLIEYYYVSDTKIWVKGHKNRRYQGHKSSCAS